MYYGDWLDEDEAQVLIRVTGKAGPSIGSIFPPVGIFDRFYNRFWSETWETWFSKHIDEIKKDDITGALTALQNLHDLADASGHTNIVALCKTERVRILVSGEHWELVPDALTEAERALGLDCELSNSQPRDGDEEPSLEDAVESTRPPRELHPDDGTSWHSALALPTLVLGILAHTHTGDAKLARVRLTALHRRMDRGDGRQLGLVNVPLVPSSANPTPECNGRDVVPVKTTHPSVFFRLTFLVSASSKRDHLNIGGSGEPKRLLFAREGLALVDKDATPFACGATLAEARALDDTLARVRADLLCEMIAAAVGRWEVAEAEDRLGQLIAHLLNTGLWDLYAARVCLHQGHLAQAMLRPARATACYRLAARLAGNDHEVGLAARACDVALRLGWGDGEDARVLASAAPKGKKRNRPSPSLADPSAAYEDALTCASTEEISSVIMLCQRPGMSAALRTIGHVIAACTSADVRRSRQHLKAALALASDAGDSGLRLLILTLTSGHYAHTNTRRELLMLRAAYKISRKLGGAGALGAWIAERLGAIGAGG
ncbi:hypothetical protein AURDEDRAFT_167813 [Auricularia subglabra TFB-10046 SS5]|nr:hypothetical protein AURDEDRAFT_167813 [Auricularia subglabra TFB-10046 SS5]